MAGSGGVFGIYGNADLEGGASVGNSDTYAKEHGAIVPKLLGIYTRAGKLKRKKKKNAR
jgi:hypothetical protein